MANIGAITIVVRKNTVDTGFRAEARATFYQLPTPWIPINQDIEVDNIILSTTFMFERLEVFDEADLTMEFRVINLQFGTIQAMTMSVIENPEETVGIPLNNYLYNFILRALLSNKGSIAYQEEVETESANGLNTFQLKVFLAGNNLETDFEGFPIAEYLRLKMLEGFEQGDLSLFKGFDGTQALEVIRHMLRSKELPPELRDTILEIHGGKQVVKVNQYMPTYFFDLPNPVQNVFKKHAANRTYARDTLFNYKLGTLETLIFGDFNDERNYTLIPYAPIKVERTPATVAKDAIVNSITSMPEDYIFKPANVVYEYSKGKEFTPLNTTRDISAMYLPALALVDLLTGVDPTVMVGKTLVSRAIGDYVLQGSDAYMKPIIREIGDQLTAWVPTETGQNIAQTAWKYFKDYNLDGTIAGLLYYYTLGHILSMLPISAQQYARHRQFDGALDVVGDYMAQDQALVPFIGQQMYLNFAPQAIMDAFVQAPEDLGLVNLPARLRGFRHAFQDRALVDRLRQFQERVQQRYFDRRYGQGNQLQLYEDPQQGRMFVRRIYDGMLRFLQRAREPYAQLRDAQQQNQLFRQNQLPEAVYEMGEIDAPLQRIAMERDVGGFDVGAMEADDFAFGEVGLPQRLVERVVQRNLLRYQNLQAQQQMIQQRMAAQPAIDAVENAIIAVIQNRNMQGAPPAQQQMDLLSGLGLLAASLMISKGMENSSFAFPGDSMVRKRAKKQAEKELQKLQQYTTALVPVNSTPSVQLGTPVPDIRVFKPTRNFEQAFSDSVRSMMVPPNIPQPPTKSQLMEALTGVKDILSTSELPQQLAIAGAGLVAAGAAYKILGPTIGRIPQVLGQVAQSMSFGNMFKKTDRLMPTTNTLKWNSESRNARHRYMAKRRSELLGKRLIGVIEDEEEQGNMLYRFSTKPFYQFK